MTRSQYSILVYNISKIDLVDLYMTT